MIHLHSWNSIAAILSSKAVTNEMLWTIDPVCSSNTYTSERLTAVSGAICMHDYCAVCRWRRLRSAALFAGALRNSPVSVLPSSSAGHITNCRSHWLSSSALRR